MENRTQGESWGKEKEKEEMNMDVGFKGVSRKKTRTKWEAFPSYRFFPNVLNASPKTWPLCNQRFLMNFSQADRPGLDSWFWPLLVLWPPQPLWTCFLPCKIFPIYRVALIIQWEIGGEIGGVHCRVHLRATQKDICPSPCSPTRSSLFLWLGFVVAAADFDCSHHFSETPDPV